MMAAERARVLVSGAGPGGLTAALLLAAAGSAVTVPEPARHPLPALYAEVGVLLSR
jgi:2-polyprenyl-6-methoxyphenol hydroxylase-like FAD-dependent oxidoreductase